MRAVVRDIFFSWTGKLEGAGIAWPYQDIRGLVTIAYGNLIDPMSLALGLPFVWPNGRAATTEEIASQWQACANDPFAAVQGHRYAEKLTQIRLTPDGIERLVLGRLDANNAALVKRCPEFEEWPACAQLALHSWAWACGPSAYFPKLMEALWAEDYEAAAVHVHINEWTTDRNGKRILNGGLVPRNVANKVLMRNAGRVRAYKLDPDTLEWERDLDVTKLDTVPEAVATEPVLHPDVPLDPRAYPDGPGDPDDVA